jgi:hypothetical protein
VLVGYSLLGLGGGVLPSRSAWVCSSSRIGHRLVETTAQSRDVRRARTSSAGVRSGDAVFGSLLVGMQRGDRELNRRRQTCAGSSCRNG